LQELVIEVILSGDSFHGFWKVVSIYLSQDWDFLGDESLPRFLSLLS